MPLQSTATYYDSPEISGKEAIKNAAELLGRNRMINEIIEAIPEVVVILNMNRQIVALNGKAASVFMLKDPKEALGLRMGEALNCIHAGRGDIECGTTRFCAECGAANVLKNAKELSEKVESECRITRRIGDREASLDLKVSSSPINLEGENLLLFTASDIADEKRRKALERTFFHDVLNMASVVIGIAEAIPDMDSLDEFKDLGKLLNESSRQLINEIESHRDLLNAESDNFVLDLRRTVINEIIEKTASFYCEHQLARNKKINVLPVDNSIEINTDPVILTRCVGNLVKNALESSGEGETITISGEAEEDSVIIKVHNNAVMPPQVKLQVFQRSFSTKGIPGRGIGTYSVKLFIENYLGGKVTFISSEKKGTEFKIVLPYHVGAKSCR